MPNKKTYYSQLIEINNDVNLDKDDKSQKFEKLINEFLIEFDNVKEKQNSKTSWDSVNWANEMSDPNSERFTELNNIINRIDGKLFKLKEKKRKKLLSKNGEKYSLIKDYEDYIFDKDNIRRSVVNLFKEGSNKERERKQKAIKHKEKQEKEHNNALERRELALIEIKSGKSPYLNYNYENPKYKEIIDDVHEKFQRVKINEERQLEYLSELEENVKDAIGKLHIGTGSYRDNIETLQTVDTFHGYVNNLGKKFASQDQVNAQEENSKTRTLKSGEKRAHAKAKKNRNRLRKNRNTMLRTCKELLDEKREEAAKVINEKAQEMFQSLKKYYIKNWKYFTNENDNRDLSQMEEKDRRKILEKIIREDKFKQLRKDTIYGEDKMIDDILGESHKGGANNNMQREYIRVQFNELKRRIMSDKNANIRLAAQIKRIESKL